MAGIKFFSPLAEKLYLERAFKKIWNFGWRPAAVRLVDPGQEVQEGRFPGTGWSHQRQERTFGDVKGDIVQDRDGQVFPVIGLGEMPDFYNGSFRFGQSNSLRAQDNFSGSSGSCVLSGLKRDYTDSV